MTANDRRGDQSAIVALPPYALIGVLVLMSFVLWTWLTPAGPKERLPDTPTAQGAATAVSTSSVLENDSVTQGDEGASPAIGAERLPAVVIRGARIPVEIADDAAERTLGLSKRAALADGTGLFFIFERDDTWAFWMKDMRFSIDMIWIDRDGRIVHIERNVVPESFPAMYRPPVPARYVLEVNSGMAESLGWTAGDTARIEGLEKR